MLFRQRNFKRLASRRDVITAASLTKRLEVVEVCARIQSYLGLRFVTPSGKWPARIAILVDCHGALRNLGLPTCSTESIRIKRIPRSLFHPVDEVSRKLTSLNFACLLVSGVLASGEGRCDRGDM